MSPSDLLLFYNEKVELVDWDRKARTLAQPLGHGLTILTFIVRFLQDNLIKPNYMNIYDTYTVETLFDFTKSDTLRKYNLLPQVSISTNSPDVLRRPLKTLIDNENKFSPKITPLSMVKNCIIKIFNRKYRAKNSTDSLSDKDYYYEIRKWVPTKFITNLFMTFSPISLIFICLSPVSFSTLFAILINQYLFQLILNKYQNRNKVDTILFSAVLDEYYMKRVKPVVSKKYQDVQIDATPNGSGFIKFYPFSVVRNNDIFKTHTLTGDLIRERYNKNINEFEEIKDNIRGHNVVTYKPVNLQNAH
ncbi:hypothetical protein RI543_003728 [Arxiozyma heterogenica]|uniref:Nuclear rim protein 1 n=1 Tax=Arxiozyma heterogenica TaxID=278026 RepID=A0AAN7W0G6_9SACH|nr:hypothetical protein RI543_003728 [Kazachstania heterogenica]